jgi:uncharacterized protein (DUF58 family)
MTFLSSCSRWLALALRYDFSPRWSGRVRAALLSPLGVLLISAALAILIGLVLHPRVFALAGGLLAVAGAGVCWPWLTCRAVRVSMAFDRPRAIEGTEVGASAMVTNPLPWSAWGLILRAREVVRLPRVRGRTKSVCRWVFVPTSRGVYPASTPALGTSFPFGLWESHRSGSIAEPLVVWPRTFPVGPVPTSEGADVVEGNVTRNKVGSTGDVLGVRPYRRGDSPRRIHWAQSARHDRLIVCELQSQSRPVVMIILDADATIHTLGDQGSLEWSVRVAASLAKGWLEAGAQVGLTVGDEVLSPQSGQAQVQKVMDFLARLQPTGPLAKVLSTSRYTSAVPVVVTTDHGLQKALGESRSQDLRWVVLNQAGFGAESQEPAPDTPRVWLEIPSVDDVPHALRHGTAEASHGT